MRVLSDKVATPESLQASNNDMVDTMMEKLDSSLTMKFNSVKTLLYVLVLMNIGTIGTVFYFLHK